jgi:hypothetical protein
MYVVSPSMPMSRLYHAKLLQKPGGKLMTQFIIDLVAPFLRLNSGSASGNGRPRGLIALAMAAV